MNKKEESILKEVQSHYNMSKEDLENRYRSFDIKDELFHSHIRETEWPYSAQIFVPQTFTALFEKMARLNGGKPIGRLIPREGGDVIKAKIYSELLKFQWEDSIRLDNTSMAYKWAMMDLNTRKYGASFGLATWQYKKDSSGKVVYDAPAFRVLNNRDCLYNPAYSTIKNWFQYRDYVTVKDLMDINDVSSSKSIYKNLDLLKEAVMSADSSGKIVGDRRDVNYIPKIKDMRSLNDYIGDDETPDFRTIEIITEYREDRIIVFAPRYNILLRDDTNPYNHGQIPIVHLRYIPIEDDIYGMSEIEPIEKVQKALNALTSQYIDAINMDLYRILKVRTAGVQMHTLEWGAGKVWQMDDPNNVVPLEHSVSSTNQFTNVYSVLISMFKEGMGEASAAYSSLDPFGTTKTATEIKTLETTRSIRDNFNQIFLSEAIQKQYMLWLMMDQQFVFSDPRKQNLVLRIVDKNVIDEFKKLGLDEYIPDMSDEEMSIQEMNVMEGQELDIQQVPRYPVNIDGQTLPKLKLDDTGELAELNVVPDDLIGSYDFILDVDSMRAMNLVDEKKAKFELLQYIKEPAVAQMLATQGYIPDMYELLIDAFEANGVKGAGRYFTKNDQQMMMGQPEQQMPGMPGQQPIQPDQGGMQQEPII
jgi:hypothetical protein